MAKVFYEDVFGNQVECDDEITLLGPNPPISPESRVDSHQRIRDPYGDRQRALERDSRKTSGFGNGDPSGTVDDPDWQAQHWGLKERA